MTKVDLNKIDTFTFEQALANYFKLARQYKLETETLILESGEDAPLPERISNLKLDLIAENNVILLTFNRALKSLNSAEFRLKNKVERLRFRAGLLFEKAEDLWEKSKNETNRQAEYESLIFKLKVIKKEVEVRNRLRTLNSARMGRFIKLLDLVNEVNRAVAFDLPFAEFKETFDSCSGLLEKLK